MYKKGDFFYYCFFYNIVRFDWITMRWGEIAKCFSSGVGVHVTFSQLYLIHVIAMFNQQCLSYVFVMSFVAFYVWKTHLNEWLHKLTYLKKAKCEHFVMHSLSMRSKKLHTSHLQNMQMTCADNNITLLAIFLFFFGYWSLVLICQFLVLK